MQKPNELNNSLVKKLHPNQLVEVNKAIDTIIKNPDIGEKKKGSLSWLNHGTCRACDHGTGRLMG
ncbi:MAG: type II toxin-antitoxin system RelE/ParE family toxin [Treponema sp.]|nr:type II toxin-antitoxin system RelE/ParE family toxin [Treponema sp.]